VRAALLLFLLLPAFGVLLRPAQAEASEHETRVAALVTALEAHAAWCQKGKLFLARNETYALLLTFAPEHAKARKWLKYKRAKDGTWTRSPRYKPPRNMKAVGAEVSRRQQALGDRFADETLAWLRGHSADVSTSARARLNREMARAAPHRTEVREANGEVLTAEGTWLLQESVRAPRERAALRAATDRALARLPRAKEVRPTRSENATQLPWKAILQGPRVRVLGTVPLAELTEAYALASAAFPVFETVYGGEAPDVPGLTIMLITSDDERATLLKNHPSATKAFRSFAASLASGWFPKTTSLYARSSDRAKRLEWCARQPLAALLRRQFRVRTKHGWAFEGFGLYVSHLLSGQRRTFYVRRTQYGDGTDRDGDLWARLTEDGADWRAHARSLLASDRAPDLRLLLGKEVNGMNTEDMLTSYVLAAFILEGHPDRAAPLLEAIGAGKPVDEALQIGLGLDVEGLGLRLRRWLDETKP
jgi:hypothetical protein